MHNENRVNLAINFLQNRKAKKELTIRKTIQNTKLLTLVFVFHHLTDLWQHSPSLDDSVVVSMFPYNEIEIFNGTIIIIQVFILSHRLLKSLYLQSGTNPNSDFNFYGGKTTPTQSWSGTSIKPGQSAQMCSLACLYSGAKSLSFSLPAW